ncbi:hypothetical protein ACFQ4P_00115 [Lacticaseibacillus mingshuiensis]|uniref:Uncharacterized protein n=2 Tax=Lacticaseibacillus mingshuiensis TaxID=2799574 RepID=A0ABW4CFD6_9LACO
MKKAGGLQPEMAVPLAPKVSFKTATFAGLKSLGSVPAISGRSPPGATPMFLLLFARCIIDKFSLKTYAEPKYCSAQDEVG